MGNPEEDTESLRLHNRLDIAENNTYDWKISNCRERSMLRLQELLYSPRFLIMSKLQGLDAYGYVVNAWLDGELETSGLSEIPALGWFWSDLLKHRMWMIDELENWAGIIRENDQPFGDGEGFREEDPGDHVDQHQEDEY